MSIIRRLVIASSISMLALVFAACSAQFDSSQTGAEDDQELAAKAMTAAPSADSSDKAVSGPLDKVEGGGMKLPPDTETIPATAYVQFVDPDENIAAFTDAHAKVAQYYDPYDGGDEPGETDFVLEAVGGSGEGYDWSAVGMPPGLNLVAFDLSDTDFDGHKALIKGTVLGEAVVGPYMVTITAADEGVTGGSATLILNITVDPVPELPEGPDECAQPFTIDYVGEEVEGWQQDTIGLDDLGAMNVILDEKSVQARFRTSGGKLPLKYTWTSKVRNTLHCWKNPTANYQSILAWGKIDYEPWRFTNPAEPPLEDQPFMTCDDSTAFINEHYLPDTSGDSDAAWTQNVTWHPLGWPMEIDPPPARCGNCNTLGMHIGDPALGEPVPYYIHTPRGMPFEPDEYTIIVMGPDLADPRELTLEGDIRYADYPYNRNSPLPVNRSGYQDINPVEELKVMVQDSCPNPRTASAQVNITVKYPIEPLKNIEGRMKYKGLDLAGESEPVQQYVRLYFQENPGELDTSEGGIYFDLKELPKCSSGSCWTEWTEIEDIPHSDGGAPALSFEDKNIWSTGTGIQVIKMAARTNHGMKQVVDKKASYWASLAAMAPVIIYKNVVTETDLNLQRLQIMSNYFETWFSDEAEDNFNKNWPTYEEYVLIDHDDLFDGMAGSNWDETVLRRRPIPDYQE